MSMWLCSAAAVLLLAGAVQAAQGVRGDYKSPTLAVPYAAVKPAIDGVIGAGEWDGAIQVDALQTVEGKLSARPTAFYLTWDEDNLYIAMRSPLRDGERLIQARRHTDRDSKAVVFDDSYEIWLNADTTSPDGQRVFFQYLGNFAGARYDVMFEPAVGNSRPGWTSNWKPVSRLSADGWELELAIPRETLFVNTPFSDGQVLRGLFVRNLKRPWEQNSVGGSGAFSAPDTHARLVLSKAAPAIRLQKVVDAKSDRLGADLTVLSHTAGKLAWHIDSDGGVHRNGTADVPAGQPFTLISETALDTLGEGDYRIRVTSTDGSDTYLDWCSRRQLGDKGSLTEKIVDSGTDLALDLVFNPVHNFVRIDGDLINYDARDSIKRYVARVVDSSGKTVVAKDLSLDSLAYVQGVLPISESPAGQYTASLRCLDASGKMVAEKTAAFQKKDLSALPWWNTMAGDIGKVIEPWTPVRCNDGQVDVWGRAMEVGPAGLPGRMSSQGQELVAGPALVAELADGTIASAGMPAVRTVEAADHRAVFEARSSLGDLDVTSNVTCEFDGMYKVEMRLTPRSALTVKSLKVRVPLKPDAADFYHASGEGIRYGFAYGPVPTNKTGRLWDSTDVDGQPMLVGSFIPFVWVGNDKAGLAWFADSDEGWVPNDKTPAIELRRDSAQSVDLVLNLISDTFTIDRLRTITFAFQATPVKPLHKGWRMDTWWTGDSFKDWSQVESEGGAGNMGLIFSAIPFPLNPDRSREMVDARHRENVHFGVPKYKANAVPYFENTLTTESRERYSPDITYFKDQWRARVSDALCWDKTSTDYIVWNLDKWCKDSGIDGWYIDNVRPIACDNIDAGRGYRLPDGRVQPTYQIFATREAFLRIRGMFAENGKSGKFVLHMTNNFVIPWLGAADIALDGEDHVIFPEMGKDFIDFWSLDRMRLAYWRQWGMPVTFLQEYQGRWEPDDMKRVMRAYTGMTILHDIHPGANPNGNNPEVWRARDRFGIEADDVVFVPYWEKGSGIQSMTANVYTAAWRRPGKLLLAVVNVGEKADAQLRIDMARLGITAVARAVDAETGEVLRLSDGGEVQLPVARHDYRQVLIEPAK